MSWKPLYTPSDRELAEFKNQYSGRVRLLVDENAGAEVAHFLADSFNTNTSLTSDSWENLTRTSLLLRGRKSE